MDIIMQPDNNAVQTDKERSSSAPNHKWFGLSLQALVVLSHKPNACTSAELAGHIKSEATMLRRVLAKLAKEQLLETREGRDGGYRLKRAPETITLADVYLALRVGAPLCNGMMDTTGIHDFGQEMRMAFMEITDEVERKTLEVLRQVTIAQLSERICTLRRMDLNS
ncbi:transcriptional regulator /BadM/Rrf2 family transcriptional regulator [Paenibacillus sp. BK033]|uniref:Rrf2 family transcriptional regulator n=1 Tax=Paenibacillus sp. BK033 TaxID=2512133 RepID=UPI00104980B3|nr:Rrf2 family transcriptional regulator [Paenibacillus sp. BK033]TCM90785.1 transcriptional regulator /BadM/Rrf2 family transcriptional regulator [Paenibacillus sp. BK033]